MKIGTVDIGVRLDYINSVLTEQSRKDGSLPLSQFIEIVNLEYIKEDKFIIFECELHEHQLN